MEEEIEISDLIKKYVKEKIDIDIIELLESFSFYKDGCWIDSTIYYGGKPGQILRMDLPIEGLIQYAYKLGKNTTKNNGCNK